MPALQEHLLEMALAWISQETASDGVFRRAQACEPASSLLIWVDRDELGTTSLVLTFPPC